MMVRPPLYVVWEVTLRCNARCVHCYSAAGPWMTAAAEPTTAEALDIIDQLADAGVLVLGFSGGEALLRPDWPQLVGHALHRGLRVTVGTNGSVITDPVAAQLKELGIHSVTVSLDGATAAVHEHIRKVPGLFDRAVHGIELLVRHGVPVIVGFTPMRHNYGDARPVVELAWRLGASKVNLSEFLPVGRGTLDLALTPAELHAVLRQWLDLEREFRGRMRLTWHDCRVALLVEEAQRYAYKGCGAAVTTGRIMLNLDVTPCIALPVPAGNLRQLPFRQIWNTAPLLQRLRDRDQIQQGNCAACLHKYTCGGCRAVAYAASGDPFAGDPYCWLVPEPPAPAGPGSAAAP